MKDKREKGPEKERGEVIRLKPGDFSSLPAEIELDYKKLIQKPKREKSIFQFKQGMAGDVSLEEDTYLVINPELEDIIWEKPEPLHDFISGETPYTETLFHTWQRRREESEHEITRQHVSEKIDELSAELAKKEDLIKLKDEIIEKVQKESDALSAELAKTDDIIKAKEEIIEKVEKESKEIQQYLEEKIAGLQESLSRFLPYKRMFRGSFYLLMFFLFSVLSEILLGITIVATSWAWLGVSISAAFLLMSYFSFLDWRNKKKSVRG